MKLPQVHIAVNVGGLAAAVGSAVTWAVANQSCVASAVPQKDALAVTAVLGTLAAFLPTKRNGVAQSAEASKSTSVGNDNSTRP